MGKLLYQLSFYAETNDENFNRLNISSYFNIFDWNDYMLNIPFSLEGPDGITISLIIKKNIYTSKNASSNSILFKCYYEIETYDATSCGHIVLDPVIHPFYKGHFMFTEYHSKDSYNKTLLFDHGYTLKIGYNLKDYLKIIHDNKLINIIRTSVISDVIIDHNLNHWFC